MEIKLELTLQEALLLHAVVTEAFLVTEFPKLGPLAAIRDSLSDQLEIHLVETDEEEDD